MDEIVRAALKKWPDVPACYGWLALDARGDWYMRDDRVQAAGPFPAVKGSRIQHAKLRAFIERNYAAGDDGCWFFQNGPQRVFVELEAAPWVWRVAPDRAVSAHDGRPARVQAVFVDEQGRVFLRTDLGFGIVHTLDMVAVADAVEAGDWAPEPVRGADLPRREGYLLSPQAHPATA